MQVSGKLFSFALLPLLASLVVITFAKLTPDKQLIQFMSSFMNVKHIVPNVQVSYNSLYQVFNHLNHTDISENWLQSFYMNDQFYKDGGPILLVVGASSELSEPDIRHPVWTEMVQRANGVLFLLDHRYYGKSQPSNHRLKDYMTYLSSELALDDIMMAAMKYKTRYNTSKCIVVGESHGGNLAAWSKLKFPHYVDGAVVVNAPFEPKLEFKTYFGIVNAQLSTYMGVMETIKEAYKVIADDIANDRYDELKNKLKLCSNPDIGDKDKNIQYMLWSVTWYLGTITKLYDTEIAPYKTVILDIFADASQSDPVKRLKNALEIILSLYHSLCIHVNYEEAVEFLSNVEFDAEHRLPKTLRSGLGNRQHFWQFCTEFGYMKTSTIDKMFGDVPLDFFIDFCKDVFGDWYNEDILNKSIKTTNTFYAGKNINTSKILFINYDSHIEYELTISEINDTRDFTIVNVPFVPDTPEDLTDDQRNNLKQKYDAIYEYIKNLTKLEHLEPPNVEAHRVPDVNIKAECSGRQKIVTRQQYSHEFLKVGYKKVVTTQIINVPNCLGVNFVGFTNVKQIVHNDDVHYASKLMLQEYDHLNHITSERWNQRYYANQQFFEEGGPIILVVGELSKITDINKSHPVWTEMVQRSNGLLFFLEQRYYGQSHPTPFTTELFKEYFSSEQVLYDITSFIDFYNDDFPESKWIIVGEGQGGKFAAWCRLKFPHLVEGAVVINAPLMPKLEFREYFDVVNEQLSRHTGVMQTIKDAYEVIDEDIKHKRFDNLINKLMLCSNPAIGDIDKNIQYMLWSVTWHLGTVTKLYDTENAPYKTIVLNTFADASQSDPVMRLKTALELLLSRFHSSCIHVDYAEAVELLKNVDSTPEQLPKTLRSGLGSREEFWQSCTEFGYMKTSTKENMFGDVKLEFFIGLCKDVFGDWYDQKILVDTIQTTNMLYAGKDIDASKILFINYEGHTENELTISKINDTRDFTIVNVPDFPDTPEKLTIDMRISLLQKYDEIYEFVKDRAKVDYLEPPNVEACRVPDVDEEADKQLIQFMSSFMNVKQIVPYVKFTPDILPQVFNHLNHNTITTWPQSFYSNVTYYEDGSPVIIVVRALSEFTETDIRHPVWTEFVQRIKGALYVLESRFYGKSHPSVHTTEEYMKYFSVEQTVNDIMTFIFDRLKFHRKSKWIVVGESLGGTLAAWGALKFPHYVDGAVVVNAPLMPKLEFNEYFDIVNKHLSEHTGVMDTIKDAYKVVAEDIANNRYAELKDKLRLCTDPRNGKKNKNIEYMFWSITWNLGIIMELKETDQYKIKVLEVFASTSIKLPVERLKKALEVILSRSDSTCIHVDYEQAVKWLKNPDLNTERKMDKTLRSGIGNRPKFWEICTQFGYMKTSTKENMFGDVKLDFFIGLCKDVFGKWYDQTILEKSIKDTKMFYAGKNIDANNILFINYDNIPEKTFTVYEKNVNRDYKIINIPDVPDTPEKLTVDMRVSLTQKYNTIYEFIKEKAGVNDLKSPNVNANRVPDVIYKRLRYSSEEVSSEVSSEESDEDE